VTGGFIANNNLNYAVCNGGCTTTAPVWGLRTLATSNAGTNFGYTSIATDPTSGNPSIAFRTDTGNGGTSGIGYTACTGGCNQSSAAFTGILYIAADVGYTSPPGRGDDTTTSIAISSTGQPSIAYGDIGNGVLQYAHCAANCSQAAGWTLVTVDQNQVGQYASLALSPLAATLDLPRISYYDGNNQNLKFAQATGNQWLINTLDQSGNVGGYTSLALSPNDNPRISYYDQTTNAIRYFTSGN